jgi:hypothetical protein
VNTGLVRSQRGENTPVLRSSGGCRAALRGRFLCVATVDATWPGNLHRFCGGVLSI